MKKFLVTVFALLVWTPMLGNAEILVVTSKGAEVSGVTLEDVRQLFSGTKRSLAGVDLTPVDMPPNSSVREEFYQQVMNKTPSQMRSYWARMTFTGKGNPPQTVNSVRELRTLLSPPGSQYIGYVQREDVSEDMAVLFALN